jgi:hypothetical protein
VLHLALQAAQADLLLLFVGRVLGLRQQAEKGEIDGLELQDVKDAPTAVMVAHLARNPEKQLGVGEQDLTRHRAFHAVSAQLGLIVLRLCLG